MNDNTAKRDGSAEDPEHESHAGKFAREVGIQEGRCCYCRCDLPPGEIMCDACDDDARTAAAENEAEKARERDERRAKAFRDLIPEHYRGATSARLSPAGLDLLSRWDPEARFGVSLCGPSRTGKTSLATILLRKAHAACRSVSFQHAGDFRASILRFAKDEPRRALAPHLRPGVLVIDDFGNSSFSPSSEEFFLTLLEKRSSQHLPTVVTTQYAPQELIGRTSAKPYGTALSKRIGREFSWVLTTWDPESLLAPYAE